MGELAYRRKSYRDGASHFEVAVRLEDGFNYVEPPQWHHPVRHLLGDALLADGRAAEAERVYGDALKRFPANGWALAGLAASLRAQGKTAEAKAAEVEFRRAWSGADVALKASRF